MAELAFLGAAGTVTGSRYLVTSRGGRDGDERALVDCGMYQGLKELRQRNWEPPTFDVSDLPFVVLTHAHIDHSGLLPRLVRQGFKGAIISTPATNELAKLLLMDAARLQEEDAAFPVDVELNAGPTTASIKGHLRGALASGGLDVTMEIGRAHV